MSRAYLIVEFSALFIALPLLLRFVPLKIPPLPVLWLACGFCLYVLLHDRSFDRSLLWNAGARAATWPNILGIFMVSAAALTVGVYFFAPKLMFSFVRSNPVFWAIVMVLYPVLSVYPQSIIYRAFLMHRYLTLFPSPGLMIVVSALAFSMMHILFKNCVAVPLTFVGGLLFAWRYQQTNSLFVSAFEHSLYGCFLFTIGLGIYFYARTI